MNRAVRSLAWALATWFGCGRSPKAPGTVGTLGAVPLYLLVARFGHGAVALAAIAATAVGVWAASVVSRDLGKKDPQVVVIDEVAGFLTTMILAPSGWRSVVLGVVVFRLFDIAKPWPIRHIERLPGGWGIVMDDVVAGIAGAGVMAFLDGAGVLR
jgi:phosphatidylglycerophosphatase A